MKADENLIKPRISTRAFQLVNGRMLYFTIVILLLHRFVVFSLVNLFFFISSFYTFKVLSPTTAFLYECARVTRMAKTGRPLLVRLYPAGPTCWFGDFSFVKMRVHLFSYSSTSRTNIHTLEQCAKILIHLPPRVPAVEIYGPSDGQENGRGGQTRHLQPRLISLLV